MTTPKPLSRKEAILLIKEGKHGVPMTPENRQVIDNALYDLSPESGGGSFPVEALFVGKKKTSGRRN